MPLLSYCILLDHVCLDLPLHGVLKAKLSSLSESGLIALCSEMEINSISPANFQQAALEFHNVIHAVFAQIAIVPFRFPTWLSAPEMKNHLREKTSYYQDFLTHHADQVQMELRLLSSESKREDPAKTGADYLRARASELRSLREQVEDIKRMLAPSIVQWRQREVHDGLRLFALIERQLIHGFREKLNGIGLRASGPWPATEFLESDTEN